MPLKEEIRAQIFLPYAEVADLPDDTLLLAQTTRTTRQSPTFFVTTVGAIKSPPSGESFLERIGLDPSSEEYDELNEYFSSRFFQEVYFGTSIWTMEDFYQKFKKNEIKKPIMQFYFFEMDDLLFVPLEKVMPDKRDRLRLVKYLKSPQSAASIFEMLNQDVKHTDPMRAFLLKNDIGSSDEFEQHIQISRQNDQILMSNRLENGSVQVVYTIKGGLPAGTEPRFPSTALLVILCHGRLDDPFVVPVQFRRYINTDFACSAFSIIQNDSETAKIALDEQFSDSEAVDRSISQVQQVPHFSKNCKMCKNKEGTGVECELCEGIRMHARSVHRSGFKDFQPKEPMFNKIFTHDEISPHDIIIRGIDAVDGEVQFATIKLSDDFLKLSTLVEFLYGHGVRRIIGCDHSCSPYSGPHEYFKLFGGTRKRRAAKRWRTPFRRTRMTKK